MCITSICKILLHTLITLFLSFSISVLLCWFAFFFKFSFPSDSLVLVLWYLFFLSKVSSGSKPICFSSAVCYNVVLISCVLALNCVVVACVTKIVSPVNVRALLNLLLSKSSAFWNAVNFKCFYVLIWIALQVYFSSDQLILIFWRNTTGNIKHTYNTFIQHSRTTCTSHF